MINYIPGIIIVYLGNMHNNDKNNTANNTNILLSGIPHLNMSQHVSI